MELHMIVAIVWLTTGLVMAKALVENTSEMISETGMERAESTVWWIATFIASTTVITLSPFFLLFLLYSSLKQRW